MRILALETTDQTGSVAAISDSNLLKELTLEPTRRSAQTLAPAMELLLKQVGWRPRDVQLVGVSIGPGSFTGLRVGVTMAKVFAYAVGAEVLAIDTLEAIATGVVRATGGADIPVCQSGTACVLAVAADALRGDVVAQSFVGKSDGAVEPLGPQDLIPAETWLERLASGARVAGPALVKLAARLPPGVQATDRQHWFPRAAEVGRLTARYHALGRRDDLWRLVPRYFRRAAAEEKWEAMGK
jgi:tRNA threonylcarbamoyladenosine biosynthesis protein TsaB